MSESIMNKARELGLELSKSQEFVNVREAEITMMGNPEAQNIIQEFQDKQHTLHNMQTQGLALSEEQQKEFEEFHERMFTNPYISSFFKAQEIFENILDQVNKIISSSIGIDQECDCETEGQNGHGCSCGCS